MTQDTTWTSAPIEIAPRHRTHIGTVSYDVFLMPNGTTEIDHKVTWAPMLPAFATTMLTATEKAEAQAIKIEGANAVSRFFLRIAAAAVSRGWRPPEGT